MDDAKQQISQAGIDFLHLGKRSFILINIEIKEIFLEFSEIRKIFEEVSKSVTATVF